MRDVKLEGPAARVVNTFKTHRVDMRVVRKEDSRFMRAIAKVYRVTGNNFWKYNTTIGRTVYVPAKKRLYTEQDAAMLYHEGVHAYDYTKHPVRFVVGYLWPHAFSVLLWILSVVMAPFGALWWPLFVFSAVLGMVGAGLFFVESPGRLNAEARGYGASVAYRVKKGVLKRPGRTIKVAAKRLSSSVYLWATRDQAKAEEAISEVVGSAGELPFFDEVIRPDPE